MLRQPLIDTHGPGQRAGERLAILSEFGLTHCVKSVDDAGWALEAIKTGNEFGVQHTIIFRQSTPGGRGDDHPNLSLPPDEAALDLWQAVKSTMPPELLPYKHQFYVEATNEIDTPAGSPERTRWVGRFCVELATLMLEDGYNPALAGFNSGQPSEDQIVEHFAELLQLYSRFPNRCLITYHEAKLKFEVNDSNGGKQIIIDHFSPLAEFDGWLVNVASKWNRAADRLGVQRPRLFVSEFTFAYDELCGAEQFRQEVSQIAQMDALHGNVVGRVIWTATRGDQWGNLRDQLNDHANWLSDYITKTLIATEEQGGDDCRGKPREQYKRTVILLPPTAGTEWAEAAVKATWALKRWTVGGSADDAGIGDLDYRQVIVVNPKEWGSDLDIWFATHYPGVIYEPVQAWTPQILIEKLAFFAKNGRWPQLTGGFQIHDIVDELPKHPTKQYGSRQLEAITHLVIHHTVSPTDRSIASIAQYHVDGNGWPGIGYHFVIKADGEIYQTNRLETISYQIGGHNSYSLGIALQGNFQNEPPPKKQQEAAAWLVGWLKKELPGIKEVKPHRGMPQQATACPGSTWESWFWQIAGTKPPTKPGGSSGSYAGPPVTFVAGVDGPASDWHWPAAKAVFDKTGLACKFHSSGQNYVWWGSYRNAIFSPVRIVLGSDFVATDANTFFNAFKGDVAQFYRQGARDFIVLNECNIEHVGSWRNGFEFGKLFKALCQLVKVNFPGARLWFPGTSPQFGAQHQFIGEAKNAGAFDEVYGVVEHVYTTNVQDAAAAAARMVVEVEDFQQRWALDRPLVIGEFAVVAPAQPGYKARVYKLFYEALAKLPGVQAAYSFTSSWHPAPDERGEGWLEHGIHDAYAKLM